MSKYSEIFFSVIICCYNSEKFIKKTIESILIQSFKNFEIIIINDGSSDNTEKIIFEIKKNYKFIKYIKQNNSGYSSARNKAITNSNGEWIVILDHDDIMYPERLQIHYDFIINNLDKKIFFGNCKILNDHQNTNKFNDFIKRNNISPVNFNNHKDYLFLLIKYGCFISSSTLAIKKDLFKKIKFKEDLKVIADYDFLLKNCDKNIFYAIDKNLIEYNSHSNQISNKFKILEKKELIKIFIVMLFYKRVNFLTKINLIFITLKNIILYNKYKYFS